MMIRKILSDKKLKAAVFLLLLCPPLICLSLVSTEESRLNEKAETISTLVQKSKITFIKRKQIQEFLASHKNTDESYVEKNIETLKFLESEKNSLASLVNHPAFQNSDSSKRYHEITNENSLQFIEEQPVQNTICKETNLRQKQSIEVNQKDLITLLHLIEDESKDKPQLIIKSLSLKKTDKNTYSCKMDLLKREFN